MKKLLSLLLALTMALALAACGTPKDQTNDTPPQDANQSQASDLDYVKGNGKLVIGYTLYAPMNFKDANGNLTGFDTELAKVICERLGVEPVFQIINWDTKEVELNAKTIDCIWNGLTINDERKANMELTQPYVKNAQVVLMKDGASYQDTSSLIGKTVVAEQGSAGEDTIKADANLKQASYIPKSVQSDCLMEVKAGTADAAILDLTLAKTMTGEGTNYADLKIMERLGEEDYGVAFRKGSDLCAEVNKLFDELRADGTLATLADKYGLDLAEAAQ